MNKKEYLLTCLAEEAGEIQQAVSKALRFGLDDVHPCGTQNNHDKLNAEIADLAAIAQMLADEGFVKRIPYNEILELFDKKRAKVQKYMEISHELGCLQASDSKEEHF